MIWIFAFVVAWVPETVRVKKKMIVELQLKQNKNSTVHITINYSFFQFLSLTLPSPPPPFPASTFYVSPSSLLPSLDRQLDFVHRASPRSREYKIKTIFGYFLVKKTHKKVTRHKKYTVVSDTSSIDYSKRSLTYRSHWYSSTLDMHIYLPACR